MFFGIDTSAFMPHGHCILWKPALLFPIVVSDLLIFFAYTSIPLAIYEFSKKRTDLNEDSKKVLVLFFLFIQLCGMTHLISAYNYWNSEYVLEMFMKVATAIVSVITAFLLFKLLPRIIALPSPEAHLKLIDELQTLNKSLEEKVRERTAKIAEQNNLLETLVEGHPGAILKYEPKFEDGKIVDFRSRLIFGQAGIETGLNDDNATVGESVVELFPDVLENGHFDAAAKAYINNQQIIEDPVFNKSLNKYFRVVNFKKADKDFLLVYFTDVTEREKVKLDALNNSKLISLGELAGGIAHEINSPLQVISGNAQILERFIPSDNKIGKKCLSSINATVFKVSEIITNLRRLSRRDEGTNNEFDVYDVVKKNIEMYEQRLKLKDIKLIKEFNQDATKDVTGIEVNVIQILNNLMSNAIDALEHRDSDRVLTVKVEEHDPFIEISIANNGPLIEDGVRDRIFEPLFTTKEVGKGTGLGLSISRRLAEDLNSELLLNQTDNTVTFTLKLKTKDEG